MKTTWYVMKYIAVLPRVFQPWSWRQRFIWNVSAYRRE